MAGRLESTKSSSGGTPGLTTEPVSLLAAALIGLGSLVLAGWLMRIAAFTQILPGYTSMVASTAICFLLSGVALLSQSDHSRALSRVGTWAAALLLLLASANAVQLATDLDLGINLPALHRWINDHNPRPGQMSEATTTSFVLAGLSLLLLRLPRRNGLVELGQSLGILISLIGLVALAGYALQLEVLYNWYLFSRMAVHTATGMSLLGVALWLRWRPREPSFSAARDVVLIGATSLFAVAALTGLLSASWFRHASEAELRQTLEATRLARAGVIESELRNHNERALIVTTRPLLLGMLRRLAEHPDDAEALATARIDIASLKPYGFSSIELHDGEGRLLVADGESLGNGLPEVEVLPLMPGDESLIWHQGFVLRNRHEIIEHGRRIGHLIAEQPLPELLRQLAPLPGDTVGDSLLLCGEHLDGSGLGCFPGETGQAMFAPPANMLGPLRAALSGSVGSRDIDEAGTAGGGSRIVYGPVLDAGLALSLGVDNAALLAPVRSPLAYGLLLVALTGIFGTLLLRARVRPLAEQLAAAEGRYALAMGALREGVMLFDADRRLLATNPMAAQLLGVDPSAFDDASADQQWPLFHAGDGHHLRAEELPGIRALSSGQPVINELTRLQLPDGRMRLITISALPTAKLPGSDQHGVVVAFDDVTERHEAEAREHAAEQRFRLMVDNIGDYAILMLDSQGVIATWNPGAERIKGYTAKEIIGQHFSVFYPEEDRRAGRPAQVLGIAAATGRHFEEGWRQRKDGTRFWASVVISAVRNNQGALIGYAKVTRDLSERRRAEAELAEAHRRLRSMIDSAPFSIITSDERGVVDHINPAAERLTYYSAAELVGGNVQPIHVREEVEARARELSQELGMTVDPGFPVFTALPSRGITDARDWTYVRKDGSQVPVHLAISAMRDPEGRITGYMGIAFDVTERKRREDYTQHVANHDQLTGLPMRALLNDRMEVALARARRDRTQVAVMMLDLDHFKRVNDSLGHHVGDELLQGVARRLCETVRGSDTVARLGGDEFVVLLPALGTRADAERIAGNIIERVSGPMIIGSHELHVTPSVGIALFPDDGNDAHELLRNADTAMYRAKAEGRRGYRMFTQDMQRRANDRLELENALRRALDGDELEVHYQPQVCLEFGRVIGMEALARWTDSRLGEVSPAVFIPIAEESGLIQRLGEWVLRRACRDARQLQLQTGVALRLAVNLSSHQFAQADLATMIGSALAEAGLAAGDLEMEVTEGVLMDETQQTVERLKSIRALGVAIAVDDFGTGFSSLAYIAHFPVNTLKIDRSFVSKVADSAGDAAVATAIIALACSLDIRVVAEGVETAAQLAFLRQRCCDAGHGWLLGKPMPAERFSVQGFHFGAACSAADFAKHFAQLAETSAERVRAVAPV